MPIPTRRIIGGIEIVSGVYIVIAALSVMSRASATYRWPASVLVACGVVSSLAGFWLWRGEQRGIAVSIGLQAAQLVQVVVPGLAFVAVLGPSLTLGLPSGAAFAFRIALDPEFLLAFGHHDNPLRIELNALAAIFLIILSRRYARRSRPIPLSDSASPAV